MNPAQAEKKHTDILRKFSNSKRLKLGLELTELALKLHRAGLKSLHKNDIRRTS